MGKIERRISIVVLASIVLSALSMVVGINWPSWVLVSRVVILAIAVALSIPALTSQCRNLDFQQVFGFISTGRKNLIKIEQRRVDEVLEGLAWKFHTVTKEQQEFFQQSVNLSENKEFSKAFKVTVDKMNLTEKYLGRKVKKAKEAFWYAYRLAKRQDRYVMLFNYHDYLSLSSSSSSGHS